MSDITTDEELQRLSELGTRIVRLTKAMMVLNATLAQAREEVAALDLYLDRDHDEER